MLNGQHLDGSGKFGAEVATVDQHGHAKVGCVGQVVKHRNLGWGRGMKAGDWGLGLAGVDALKHTLRLGTAVALIRVSGAR